jgi:hypothetical protein
MKKTLEDWLDSVGETFSEKSRKSERMVRISCPICIWYKELPVMGSRSASPAIVKTALAEHLKKQHSDRLL